jgi:ectoine hydroxylase-related dioxygenase (phytanoyl-CoA dioxygenase family)
MSLTDHVNRYQSDGYTLIPGLFSAGELDRLERSFDGIVARRVAAGAALDATWQGARWRDRHGAHDTVVLHTHDLQSYCAEWTRALTADRFTGAMSALLGTPDVQLHHTKLFLKPPERGSPFPLHQDHPHFPHERHTMMAAVLHLSDATAEMGCIRVVPGSHRLGPLPTGERYHLDPDEWPVERAVPCEAARGDVLFFSYLLVHGSGVNRSPRTRKTVLIQVRDAADRQLTDQHRSHAQGLMLRGESTVRAA